MKYKFILAGLAASAVLHSDSVFACAACFGKSDSPLAQGMNWGIFTLLGVVVCVLSGIASFGVYLVKKSATTPAVMPPGEPLPQTQKI